MTVDPFSFVIALTSPAAPKAPTTPKRQTFYREGSEETYEGIKELGEGGFGVVWEALTPHRVHHVAMKIPYLKKEIDMESPEANMLKRVQGAPHVLKYRGDFELSQRYFKDENGTLSVHTVEGGGHSHAILTDVLSTPDAYEMFIKPVPLGQVTKLTSAQILNIGTQGLETLRYLQSEKLVHRDLKPENMAYNELTNELTILDFGGAQNVEEINPQELEGTLSYRAPEQMLFKPYDASVDVWSLAVTLFELYTAYPLIEAGSSEDFNQTLADYLHVMTQNLGVLPSKFIQSVSIHCKHFFRRDGSIAYCPSERANENLRYFAYVGKKGEKMLGKEVPIWKARIHFAAQLKGEKPADAEKVIDFLEPMLRYEKRITPEKALQKLEQAARPKEGSPSPRGMDPASCLSNFGQKFAAACRSGESPSLQNRALQISTEEER